MIIRAIFFAACFFTALISSVANAADPDRPNILWISAEDIGPQLGCYGFDIKTPNIDAFAKRSLTYKTAWSTYPVCAPARTTIITGRYATALGAGNMRCDAIKPTWLKLLPELMREGGYYCTNNSKTDYNLKNTKAVWDESSKTAHWKNRPDGKPFFAVFNNTETHESKLRKRPHKKQIDPASVSLPPYWPDAPEVRQDWAQYLDNIQTLDGWVAASLKELEDAGLADDTIVMFWGDHGSGMPRHKRFAGDSGMRVPLIVYVPEKWKALWSSEYAPEKRSKRLVGFIDFAPTVLAAAGIPVPDYMQGTTLLGPEARKAKYLYGVRNRMDERNDVSRSITDGRFVYIRNFMPHLPHGQFVLFQQETPATKIWYQQFLDRKLNKVQAAFWQPRAAEELYDLDSDPHETVNLAAIEAWHGKLPEFRSALRSKMVDIVDLDLVPESVLYEFEQETGKSRVEYANAEGFDIQAVFDAADGKNMIENLSSPRVEIRYWAIVNLIQRRGLPEGSQAVASMMKEDVSLGVRVKAAEFLLSRGKAGRDVVEVLLKLADIETSNYYVACNALDCLDRYRDQMDPEAFATIKSLSVKAPGLKRGSNYLEKMMTRFK